MKFKVLIALSLSILMLVTFATPIFAFNPQPEPPAKVKKIDAITNVLEGIDQRLERIPSRPATAPLGLAGELEAIAKHLQLQGGKLEAVLPVLMEPGNDWVPAEISLGEVKNCSQNIQASAEGMMVPNGDTRVKDALMNVYDNAENIIEIVDTMLATPWGGCD